MKIKLRGLRVIYIAGEYIKLDSLLKYSSIASSGGEAKYFINNGEVWVGKELCHSRGKKIKPGSIIRCGDKVLLVKKEKLMSSESVTCRI